MIQSAAILSLLGLGVATLADGATLKRPSPCSASGFKNPGYRTTSFHYDRKSRQRSPQEVDADLVFEITDTANNYTTRCQASKFLNEFLPDEYRTCFELGANTTASPTIDFNYVFATGKLALRQTWTCEQEDGSFPQVSARRGTRLQQ